MGGGCAAEQRRRSRKGTQQQGGQPGPFGGMPGPGQPSTGSATPIDPNVASVATVPLMAYAIQEAPNMNREGGVIAGQFREGQTLEQPFQLAPNKCASTVLAVGVGPQEVDILSIVAVTPIPSTSPVLSSSDNTTGPNAALGGRGRLLLLASADRNQCEVRRQVDARPRAIIAAQLYLATRSRSSSRISASHGDLGSPSASVGRASRTAGRWARGLPSGGPKSRHESPHSTRFPRSGRDAGGGE